MHFCNDFIGAPYHHMQVVWLISIILCCGIFSFANFFLLHKAEGGNICLKVN